MTLSAHGHDVAPFVGYLNQSEKLSQMMPPLKLCYLSTYLSTTQFQAQLENFLQAWLDSAQEISAQPSLSIT